MMRTGKTESLPYFRRSGDRGIVFAESDDHINSMWPGYEAALNAHIDYEMQKLPGTQHGFNNDTTPRFDEAAARVAWSKTVALFNRLLRG